MKYFMTLIVACFVGWWLGGLFLDHKVANHKPSKPKETYVIYFSDGGWENVAELPPLQRGLLVEIETEKGRKILINTETISRIYTVTKP